jgi:hypothetical protein
MPTLRTFVLAVAVLLGAVIGAAPSASAAAAPGSPGAGPGAPAGTELTVSGPFTGTGTLGSECGLFHQVVDGGGEWTALGPSTFVLDFCLAAGYEVFDATFVITAADGGTLTGDISGRVEAGGPGPDYPLHFVLTVTGGTGRYAGATGSIAMEGAFGPGAFTVAGTVDGTVTLPPASPTSWRDCTGGGWRDLVDDEGRPFHSAGHCIRWARDHT